MRYIYYIPLLLLNIIISTSIWGQTSKPNDYLVGKCENPQFGASDFSHVGLTPQNTQLLSMERYEKSNYVRDKFSTNGIFNKQLFYKFYFALKREWDRFCYRTLSENEDIESSIDYDAFNSISPRMQSDYKQIRIAGYLFWEKKDISNLVSSSIYKFDYAIIDNQKVTTVNAPNITANIINSTKATVTYQNETITLTSKDSYEYIGYGQNKVVIVANKVNGVFSRITIGATVNNQAIILIYKRINN